MPVPITEIMKQLLIRGSDIFNRAAQAGEPEPTEGEEKDDTGPLTYDKIREIFKKRAEARAQGRSPS